MIHDAKNISGMRNNLKHSASVERYLSGEMSSSEKELFEREVAANPELEEELRLSRSIDSALLRDDILDFRKKLIAVNRENRRIVADVPVVRMNFRKIWLAAASFVLLATIGSTLYFTVPFGNPNDNLFRQYYNSENLVDITRSSDANIVEAVIKFQEQDYRLAARLFHNILDQDDSNIACWFYYGISCIETESYRDAEQAFSHIIKDNQNLYVEHAEWYLGLTYLKDNQLKKAKSQFETIASNDENVHQTDAAKLLKKLE